MHYLEERIMKFENLTLTLEELLEADPDTLLRRLMSGIGIWQLIICAIGTPINALVFYLAVCISRSTGGSATGGKQQWFVASMTAADFLFTSMHSPMFFVLYTLENLPNGFSCFLFYFVTHVAVVASSLSLLLLNLDKFLALHKPLHYPSLMTTKCAVVLLILSWATSICWAAFLLFGPFLNYSSDCGPVFKPQFRIMYFAFAIVFFALPVCISVFIAVFVTVVARRSRKSKLLAKQGSGSGRRLASKWLLEMELAASNEMNIVEKKQQQSEWRRNVRAITFVFTTTLWSAVTLLPYRFAFIMYFLGHTDVVLPSIFLVMTTMNPLGNPFITILTQRQYKKKLKRLWAKIMCRHSLADNDLLSQHVAATIRMLCQQQEQLITAASTRAAKIKTHAAYQEHNLLSPISTEYTTSPEKSLTAATSIRD